MSNGNSPLHRLAEQYGVYTSYWDAAGHQVFPSDETLTRTLQALGAALTKPDEAEAAVMKREEERWKQPLEPVLLAWDGGPAEWPLRVPASLNGEAKATVQLESGESHQWTFRPEWLPVWQQGRVGDKEYLMRGLRMERRLPPGYHQLRVEAGNVTAESLLLAAPVQTYQPEGQYGKVWGVFAPLYAIHSQTSWGAGDLGDLVRLTEWVRGLGGGLVATLPLLAAFLDEPFEPGPYSPASRLFWNEFYLDVRRIPELQQSAAARKLMESKEFQAEVQALRAAPMIEYKQQMALKRRVLSELARTLFASSSPRRTELESYLKENPRLNDYARFRAVCERQKKGWPVWPERLRDGTITEADYDEEARRYHVYVQWVAQQQLRELAGKAGASGPGLYLDFPLGVNPDSYDTWRERQAFAVGTAAGAPPDPFFAKGQNWGFPPLHPEMMRRRGYRYLRACLFHHMQFAGALRIDHLMGLHRLYWIPQGMEAKAGTYVRYPAEELYAVYSLESHRNRTILVGEDLGTVPPEVPEALARHRVRRMYVQQYEVRPDPNNALTAVIPDSVASCNTHDMPPFAAFWEGLDIDDRLDLGILDQPVRDQEHRARQVMLDKLVCFLRNRGLLTMREEANARSVLRACMEYLAAGPAWVVLANLEDLWQETQPQNVPGTWKERPNWRRRAKFPLEKLGEVPGAVELLKRINEIVRRA